MISEKKKRKEKKIITHLDMVKQEVAFKQVFHFTSVHTSKYGKFLRHMTTLQNSQTILNLIIISLFFISQL